jgi:hypothetical protein
MGKQGVTPAQKKAWEALEHALSNAQNACFKVDKEILKA